MKTIIKGKCAVVEHLSGKNFINELLKMGKEAQEDNGYTVLKRLIEDKFTPMSDSVGENTNVREFRLPMVCKRRYFFYAVDVHIFQAITFHHRHKKLKSKQIRHLKIIAE